jgi:nucleotide-binding universal stress UspA family protein
MLDIDNRNVAEVIVDEAARWPADLIVVGTTDVAESVAWCSAASRKE